MDRITLCEELRLIERSEVEVSGAWKGAHLLLFFLAFVFGSFCTFCFHMLMYLFDEKCVLFPKLLSLSALRHNIIYDFLPPTMPGEQLPVDFLSTQFVEKSACYLPTYVPLVSGIFGLIWTTMFLMCSSGSHSLSGLQRPWRVIPPVMIFSVAMSCLCIYSSSITHIGLRQLCSKLGVITGNPDCSYAVNVATLAYERQIRGVYQATRLTIISAWMHTFCWIASAILAIFRILLAVDFRLVKIRAELIGDSDRMLERNEEQLRTVLPSQTADESRISLNSTQVYFENKHYEDVQEFGQLIDEGSNILFISDQTVEPSEQALLVEEWNKSARIQAYDKVPHEHELIVDIVYDLIDFLDFYTQPYLYSSSSINFIDSTDNIHRQFGQSKLGSRSQSTAKELSRESEETKSEAPERVKEQIHLQDIIDTSLHKKANVLKPQLSPKDEKQKYQSKDEASTRSELKIGYSTSSLVTKEESDEDNPKPGTSKDVSIQTDKKHRKPKKQLKVSIADDNYSDEELDSSEGSSTEIKKEKEPEKKPKEKQD